jgi:branched-chain amino acid transport system ATP-binding protein
LEKKNSILELEDIHTFYGRSHVIQGLTLYVKEQEAVSIIGRNGVGKTTTLRSIMGLTPPGRGKIRIQGNETTKWPPHKISQTGVAYVPAERDIFPGLNVEDNLLLAERQAKGEHSWTLNALYEQFPLLKERAKQDGSTLSGGEQQLLAIARALMSNPRIMIIDEPSQGLSPFMVKKIAEVILYCVGCGITLLIVEQNYRLALEIASRHYLMDNKGKINRISSSEELSNNPEIIEKHLSV